MSALENEIEKYQKRGFKVHRKRTKKHGKILILTQEKGGLSGFLGAETVRVIYYAEGDSNTNNIREFLKEYKKLYTKNDFDEDDRGVFMCSGNLDKGLFRDLKKALVRDKDILRTISTKGLPKVAIEKRKKVVEEERIRERITEREITRRKVTEEHVSVKGLLSRIRKFEPLTKPKREKQLENMLVSNLQAFYPNVRTQQAYGGARIDAQIGNIGIEVKYQPSIADFDRLYGQIERYLKHLGYVIAIVGYERSKQSTTSFKKRLKERGWLNKRVYVITK